MVIRCLYWIDYLLLTRTAAPYFVSLHVSAKLWLMMRDNNFLVYLSCVYDNIWLLSSMHRFVVPLWEHKWPACGHRSMIHGEVIDGRRLWVRRRRTSDRLTSESIGREFIDSCRDYKTKNYRNHQHTPGDPAARCTLWRFGLNSGLAWICMQGVIRWGRHWQKQKFHQNVRKHPLERSRGYFVNWVP